MDLNDINALRRAGRPTLSELDRWPRQAWTRSVLVATGVRLHELEKRYGAFSSCSGRFTRVWYKYKDGARPIPEWLFQRVGNDYPETRKWLCHPLWKLLAPKVSLSQVYDAMLGLPIEVVKLLYLPQDGNGVVLRGPRSSFTLPLLFISGKWRNVECSDRYAACLGLMREAEILLDQESHSASKHFLEYELGKFMLHPVLGFLASDVHRRAMDLLRSGQEDGSPMRAKYEEAAEEERIREAANLRIRSMRRPLSNMTKRASLKKNQHEVG